MTTEWDVVLIFMFIRVLVHIGFASSYPQLRGLETSSAVDSGLNGLILPLRVDHPPVAAWATSVGPSLFSVQLPSDDLAQILKQVSEAQNDEVVFVVQTLKLRGGAAQGECGVDVRVAVSWTSEGPESSSFAAGVSEIEEAESRAWRTVFEGVNTNTTSRRSDSTGGASVKSVDTPVSIRQLTSGCQKAGQEPTPTPTPVGKASLPAGGAADNINENNLGERNCSLLIGVFKQEGSLCDVDSLASFETSVDFTISVVRSAVGRGNGLTRERLVLGKPLVFKREDRPTPMMRFAAFSQNPSTELVVRLSSNELHSVTGLYVLSGAPWPTSPSTSHAEEWANEFEGLAFRKAQKLDSHFGAQQSIEIRLTPAQRTAAATSSLNDSKDRSSVAVSTKCSSGGSSPLYFVLLMTPYDSTAGGSDTESFTLTVSETFTNIAKYSEVLSRAVESPHLPLLKVDSAQPRLFFAEERYHCSEVTRSDALGVPSTRRAFFVISGDDKGISLAHIRVFARSCSLPVRFEDVDSFWSTTDGSQIPSDAVHDSIGVFTERGDVLVSVSSSLPPSSFTSCFIRLSVEFRPSSDATITSTLFHIRRLLEATAVTSIGSRPPPVLPVAVGDTIMWSTPSVSSAALSIVSTAPPAAVAIMPLVGDGTEQPTNFVTYVHLDMCSLPSALLRAAESSTTAAAATATSVASVPNVTVKASPTILKLNSMAHASSSLKPESAEWVSLFDCVDPEASLRQDSSESAGVMRDDWFCPSMMVPSSLLNTLSVGTNSRQSGTVFGLTTALNSGEHLECFTAFPDSYTVVSLTPTSSSVRQHSASPTSPRNGEILYRLPRGGSPQAVPLVVSWQSLRSYEARRYPDNCEQQTCFRTCGITPMNSVTLVEAEKSEISYAIYVQSVNENEWRGGTSEYARALCYWETALSESPEEVIRIPGVGSSTTEDGMRQHLQLDVNLTRLYRDATPPETPLLRFAVVAAITLWTSKYDKRAPVELQWFPYRSQLVQLYHDDHAAAIVAHPSKLAEVKRGRFVAWAADFLLAALMLLGAGIFGVFVVGSMRRLFSGTAAQHTQLFASQSWHRPDTNGVPEYELFNRGGVKQDAAEATQSNLPETRQVAEAGAATQMSEAWGGGRIVKTALKYAGNSNTEYRLLLMDDEDAELDDMEHEEDTGMKANKALHASWEL